MPTGRGRGVEHDVDHIVVDEDRPDVELAAEVERDEEAVVDDHVARDFADAGGGDLFGEAAVAGQRVGGGELGVAERVGFVVVVVGDGERAVGVSAAAHGEVAGGDEDQVAGEDAVGDGAAAVDRREEAVVRAEVIERQPDREELADGADEELAVGGEVVKDLAGIEVDDAEAPGGVLVEGFVEDGLDVGRDGLGGGGRGDGGGGRDREQRQGECE